MTKKTNSQLNYVLSEACLESLLANAQAGKDLARYRKGGFEFSGNQLIPHPEIAPESAVVLDSQSGNPSADSDNAARLYEALATISETTASDIRFWTYLCHGPLFDYMRQRWSVAEDPEAGTSTVLRRWMFHGDARVRAISRNGLSRLWWGAHLTKAPWELDEFFSPLKHKDRFLYTKTLFEFQDVFEGLFGRGIGRDRHILIGTLELLRTDSKLQKDRERVRGYLRRLNLESFHSVLGVIPLRGLLGRLEKCAS